MEKDTFIGEIGGIELDGASTASQSRELIASEYGTKTREVMDRHNPRNWNRMRKTLLFASLMGSSLLADGYVFMIGVTTNIFSSYLSIYIFCPRVVWHLDIFQTR